MAPGAGFVPVGAKEASGFPQFTGGAEVAAAVGVLEGFADGTGVVVYTPLLEQPVVTSRARAATAAPNIVLWVVLLLVLVLLEVVVLEVVQWVFALWVLVPRVSVPQVSGTSLPSLRLIGTPPTGARRPTRPRPQP
jgi:hypothetical protein